MRSPQWVKGARDRADQVMMLAGEVRGWAERTIVWRVWERMLENEFIDRGVALAAKAFVSFFPAVIVVAAFAPPAVRAAIGTTLARRSGMSGESLVIFRTAFAASDDVRRATGVLGLVFTVYYINSFTSALRRAYLRAWRRPSSGLVYGYALAAVWLVGILAYFSLLGGMRAAFGRGPGLAAFGVLALAAAIGLWWITPWLMLGRQVRLRVLFPTAVLTAVGMTVYGVTSSLWMPAAVSQNQRQFGFFGVALAMVTWLSGAAFIVVASACAAPVLAEDRGVLGRLVRGRNPAALVPGAVPSLGAPPAGADPVQRDRARTRRRDQDRAGSPGRAGFPGRAGSPGGADRRGRAETGSLTLGTGISRADLRAGQGRRPLARRSQAQTPPHDQELAMLERALLQPVEHLLGDLAPAVVDRERVTAVGELPEVGDRG